MKHIEKFSKVYYISIMNRSLSNEIWDQLCPDKFTLLNKLTKTAVEQVEKEERYDWDMSQFLKEMQQSFQEKVQEASSAEKRRQEKRQRRLEHEKRVKEAQDRKHKNQKAQEVAIK